MDAREHDLVAEGELRLDGRVALIAGAGRFIGEPDGYRDMDMTPESFVRALLQIDSSQNLMFPTDSYSHATMVREGHVPSPSHWSRANWSSANAAYGGGGET